jgi:hypothetical protein
MQNLFGNTLGDFFSPTHLVTLLKRREFPRDDGRNWTNENERLNSISGISKASVLGCVRER